MKPNKYKLNNQQELGDELRRLLQIGHFSDVNVHCNNTVFPCHRVILAMQCPFFHSMFTSGMKECVKGEVFLDFEAHDSLIGILKFMYGEQLDVSHDAENLLGAAEFLQMKTISDACCNYLLDTVCPRNLIAVWDVLEKYRKTDSISRLIDHIAAQFKIYSKVLDFSILSFDRALEIIKSPAFLFESDIPLSTALQWSTIQTLNCEEFLWTLIRYLESTTKPESEKVEQNSSTLLMLASLELKAKFWNRCTVTCLLEVIERSRRMFRLCRLSSTTKVHRMTNANLVAESLICQCNDKNFVIFVYENETIIYNLKNSKRTTLSNDPSLAKGDRIHVALCGNYLFVFNGHQMYKARIDHYKCTWKRQAPVPNNVEHFIAVCDKNQLHIIDSNFNVFRYDEAFDEWKPRKTIAPDFLKLNVAYVTPVYHSHSLIGHLIIFCAADFLIVYEFTDFPTHFNILTLPTIPSNGKVKHLEMVETEDEKKEILVQDERGDFWEFDNVLRNWIKKEEEPTFNSQLLNRLLQEELHKGN